MKFKKGDLVRNVATGYVLECFYAWRDVVVVGVYSVEDGFAWPIEQCELVESQKSTWVIDRRPTEEDADPNGNVCVVTAENVFSVVHWNCPTAQLADVPWQPTPPTLLVEPPTVKTCHNCNGGEECERLGLAKDQDGNEYDICIETLRIGPEYGLDWCIWEEDE